MKNQVPIRNLMSHPNREHVKMKMNNNTTQSTAAFVCPQCHTKNSPNRYFCRKCGTLLDSKLSGDAIKVCENEIWKLARIAENISQVPHSDIVWDDTVDLYARKIEQLRELFRFHELGLNEVNSSVDLDMTLFLDNCRQPEFQIAFVGTIKTGKSTLINSLLGGNYASMDVTPETAALTKFRYSTRDYVRVTFYTPDEWNALWKSVSRAADAFMKEYKELNAAAIKDNWVGHKPISRELDNTDIREELTKWSSSKHAEHYFVKEIEVGISSLPANFPSEVVFVDTPGLSDPVGYRSDITRGYIRKANAVFMCIDAQKIQKEEIETISSVFSFASNNKNKVFIIATHWDVLNDLVNDWKKQLTYLEGRLVGPGFYPDENTARANIMKSAAYIYNICRDFNPENTQDVNTLKIFALKNNMPIPDSSDLPSLLDTFKEKTGIAVIMEKITNVLAINYKSMLAGDLGNAYQKIIFQLRRIGNERCEQERSFISTSDLSLEDLKKQLLQQEKNLKTVTESAEKLKELLDDAEKKTKARMKGILAFIEQKSALLREKKN